MHNSREEIKEIAPTLSSKKVDNGYTMPTDYFDNMQSKILQKIESEKLENYFDKLPERVLQKINKENNKEQKWTINLMRIAAVACIIFMSVFAIQKIDTNIPSTQYAQLSDEEIEEMMLVVEDLSLEEMIEIGIISDENIEEVLPEINTEIEINNYIDEYNEEELIDLL